jgi:hypothetical protein
VKLPLLPQDKANHVVYGAVIAAAVSVYDVQKAAAVVMLFAVGKELSDWWQNRKGGNHGVEVMDAVATVGGGAIVLLPQFLKGVL